MGYNYLLVNHQEGLPLRIGFHRLNSYGYHCHKELEIFFVLRGSLHINTNRHQYALTENELFITNCNQIHASNISGNDDIAIIIQIDLSFCKQYGLDFLNISFNPDELFDNGNNFDTMNLLKIFLAKIVLEMIYRNEGFHNEVLANVNHFVSHMLRRIPFTRHRNSTNNIRDIDITRLNRIQTYINENYRDRISLKDIAKKEYINLYYLTHFFKDKLGITFSDCVNQVRLEKALEMMSNKKMSITEIAMNNGFPNVKTFNRVFKRRYTISPSQFKSNLSQNCTDISKLQISARVSDDNYFEAYSEYIISKLTAIAQNEVSTHRSYK